MFYQDYQFGLNLFFCFLFSFIVYFYILSGGRGKMIKKTFNDFKNKLMDRKLGLGRLGLRSQFSILFIFCVFLLILTIEIVSRHSFNEAFSNYVSQREEQRINIWKKSLENVYVTHNYSWDILKMDQGLWWRLLMDNRQVINSTGRFSINDLPKDQLNIPELQMIKPSPNGRDHEPLPPDAVGNSIHHYFKPIVDNINSFLPSISFDPSYHPPAVALLDKDKKTIITGFMPTNEENIRWIDLTNDSNTIGWLAIDNGFGYPFDKIDKSFVDTQSKNMLIAGFFAIIFAGALGIIWAKALLRPIKQLARSTRAMASGDYTSYVKTGRTDELGQLAEDFNTMLKNVQKNEEIRKSMMADISHELRTPITILKGEIESIIDGVRKPDNDVLESLLMEIDSLHQLVNDVHDLAMSEAGGWKYNEEEVDIVALVKNVARNFNERYKQKNLSLNFNHESALPTIYGDKHRLSQLFTNLLENSYRYTDYYGQVNINIYNQKKDIKVVVEDSTPGVPPEMLNKLFERFYRMEESRNKAYGGSGLGLALCKGIVEHHQGTISPSNSDMGGLRLTITLPKKNNRGVK